MRSPLFFSHCINIYNIIYIRNFYFVILSIFSISFISSFNISFNLSILYPLYRLIRIIQINISSYYLHPDCFSLLTTLHLATTLTIVLNDTDTSSLLSLEYPTLFVFAFSVSFSAITISIFSSVIAVATITKLSVDLKQILLCV